MANQSSRREFLASSAGAFLAMHSDGIPDHQKEAPPGASSKGQVRLVSLELLAAAPLAEMKDFYHRLLGLPVLEERKDRLTIYGGDTRLTFVAEKSGDQNPFYHFAFNIPENKIVAAHTWQKERTPLIPIPVKLRDPRYPDDVVDYSHWNAHSIFFFDPAGNVVEYIARHDLKNAQPGPFGSTDILYASEIAFVVDEVASAATELRKVVGIDQYRGGSDQFVALGDEHGLLLVMKRGRVISFDAKETKAVSVFRTVVSVRGAQPAKYDFAKFPYKVSIL